MIQKLKYINIIYTEKLESVKLMVQEHYDTPEYNNSLFILNTSWAECDCTEIISNTEKYTKKIYYSFEHKPNTVTYYDNNFFGDCIGYFNELYNLFKINEIWSMDYEPQLEQILNRYNFIYKYKPVRYTSLIKPVKNIHTTPKTCDMCFVGSIGDSTNRSNFIHIIERCNCSNTIKFITNTKNLRSVTPELNTCKYILDISREKQIATQNQVRIFELLCMGYTVCAEKCSINMFPGLVYEWETISELIDFVNKNEYIHPIETYKKMTYTDEAYEKYVNYLIEQWNTKKLA